MGRIALLVAMVAATTALVIHFVCDYRRCRGPKEKRFLTLVYSGLCAFLIAAAFFGLSTIASFFVAMVALRWLARKQLEVRLFEGIEKGKRPNIPLS